MQRAEATPRRSSPVQAALLAAVLVGTAVFSSVAIAASGNDHAVATANSLVGAWRLESIEYRVDGVRRTDPFYGSSPEGLLLYDRSGWMSVHIESRPRPHLGAAGRRDVSVSSADTELRAAAYDSYYAYAGTWDVDTGGQRVTHHVTNAVIPDEEGLTYAQDIEIAEDTLTFINASEQHGSKIQRIKTWRRLQPTSAGAIPTAGRP